MTVADDAPAGIVTVADGEKLPAADDVVNVTVCVRVGGLRDARRLKLHRELSRTSPRRTSPARLVKTTVVGDHVENPCQAVVKAAPSRDVAHHAGRAGARRRLVPLSRIAAASRSRSAPVWTVKSASERPSVLFGDHANPNRSTPDGAPSERAAYTWPETKSSMFASGAAVQPYAEGHAQAALPKAT